MAIHLLSSYGIWSGGFSSFICLSSNLFISLDKAQGPIYDPGPLPLHFLFCYSFPNNSYPKQQKHLKSKHHFWPNLMMDFLKIHC